MEPIRLAFHIFEFLSAPLIFRQVVRRSLRFLVLSDASAQLTATMTSAVIRRYIYSASELPPVMSGAFYEIFFPSTAS